MPNPTPAQLSQVGKYLNSQRQIVTSTCTYCGGPTRGLRTKRYCSPKCRFDAGNAKRSAKKETTR